MLSTNTARWHINLNCICCPLWSLSCASLLFIHQMDIFIFSVRHLVRHSNIFCLTFIKNVQLSDEFRQHCRSLDIQYLMSSATLILGPGGTFSPRWALILQLVGPQWGHTWTPGCITEYFTWNSDKGSISKIVTNKMLLLANKFKRFITVCALILAGFIT